jgi:hypothetical protein
MGSEKQKATAMGGLAGSRAICAVSQNPGARTQHVSWGATPDYAGRNSPYLPQQLNGPCSPNNIADVITRGKKYLTVGAHRQGGERLPQHA